MQYNNGLKFSFSLLAQQPPPSSHSTPKFPSIEIQKQIPSKPPEGGSTPKQQPMMIIYSPTSTSKPKSRPESKGKRILQKYSHLTLLTQKDRSDKDSRSVRSVRSTQSSKSHHYHRSRNETTRPSSPLVRTVKNRHCSLSSANLTTQITQLKANTKTYSNRKETSKVQQRIDAYRGRLFEERSVGKLLNNFIDHRRTKPKTNKTPIEPSPVPVPAAPLTSIPDKGKSFKSILHKTRPVLKLGSRLLSNHRLQEMSREIPQDFNQY